MLSYFEFFQSHFYSNQLSTIVFLICIYVISLIIILAFTSTMELKLYLKRIIIILFPIAYSMFLTTFLIMLGAFLDYEQYTTQYNTCHTEEAKQLNYIYKDQLCFKKFSGYVVVNGDLIRENLDEN